MRFEREIRGTLHLIFSSVQESSEKFFGEIVVEGNVVMCFA